MREIRFSACAAMAVFLCFSALSCQGAVAGLEGGDDGGLDVPEDRVHDTDADPFGEPDAIPPGCGNGTVDPGED